MAIERLTQPAVDAAPTLPIPDQLPAAAISAWATLAPVLRATMMATLQEAQTALRAEAEATGTAARQRIAQQAAAALDTRLPGLEGRLATQLALLLTEPAALRDHWPHQAGAFALHQLCERLRTGQAAALQRFTALLPENAVAAAEPAVRGGIEGALTGLLHQCLAMDTLPAHARNVLCSLFSRQFAAHLHSSAASPAAEPATVRPSLPRALDGILTRVQLQMLDAEEVQSGSARDAFERELDACAAPQDADALIVVREALQGASDLITRIIDRHGLDAALAAEFHRLVPVLARTRLLCGQPPEQLPAVRAFLALLLEVGLDAPSERHGEAVPELIEELIGDLLSQFSDDVELWMVNAEDGRLRVSERQRNAELLRQRAVQRLAGRQRLATAQRAARPLVEALRKRAGTENFLQTWQEALTQGYLRGDDDGQRWRQLRQLTAALVLREGEALAALRAPLEKTLRWACSDGGEIDLLLDQLFALLGPAPSDTLTLQSLRGLLQQQAAAGPRLTIFDGPAHRWPVRLADGRRRYLLGLRKAGDDGQVIISDRTGQLIELEAAPGLQRDLKRGLALRLDPQRLLEDALGPCA